MWRPVVRPVGSSTLPAAIEIVGRPRSQNSREPQTPQNPRRAPSCSCQRRSSPSVIWRNSRGRRRERRGAAMGAATDAAVADDDLSQRPRDAIADGAAQTPALDASRPSRQGRASGGEALDRAQPVHRVERGDLVGLGQRRVVEDRVDEVVDGAAAAPSRPGRCARARSRRCRTRARRAACGRPARRAASACP